MTGTTKIRDNPAGGSGPRPGIRKDIVGCGRGLAFGGLAIAGTGLVLVLILPVVLIGIGLGILVDHGPGSDILLAPALLVAGLVLGRFLLPATLMVVRRLAALSRRLSGEWCGVPIASSYRPPPTAKERWASGPCWAGCWAIRRAGGICCGWRSTRAWAW